MLIKDFMDEYGACLSAKSFYAFTKEYSSMTIADAWDTCVEPEWMLFLVCPQTRYEEHLDGLATPYWSLLNVDDFIIFFNDTFGYYNDRIWACDQYPKNRDKQEDCDLIRKHFGNPFRQTENNDT